MSTQRRTSTSSTGGDAPGRDDEYPTDTFESVVGTEQAQQDAGWDELVSPAPQPPTAPVNGGDAPRRDVTSGEDERPTQVFGAIQDESPERPAASERPVTLQQPVAPARPVTPERSPVAEQLFGGSAVPEEDDTAVFARYRDSDPDPRATGATPAVASAGDDDGHTEQFSAYRDEAYDGPRQTGGAGSRSWSGPSALPVAVPLPVTPPIPAIPTGLGRAGATADAPAGADRTRAVEPPRTSVGKRALREQPEADQQPAAEGQQASDEVQRPYGGRRALMEPGTPGGPAAPGAETDGQDGPDSPERAPGDEPAAEPVLDKKAAKRLAKEQQQAAKDAAKAEKAAAEQAAKAEKLAAKAAKKAGRGRGAPELPSAAATEASAGDGAAAAPSEAGADARAIAATSTEARPDGTQAAAAPGADQPGGATATTGVAAAAPAVARRKAPVLVVLLLLVIAAASGGAAWLFQQQAVTASKQRPSSNIALLDKSATADVIAQVSKAVEAIYSYDSTSLDQSESLALSQITGSYTSDFKDNFAAVRALPPQQRASLSSKVAAAGVITLTERRASLLVMLDQVGRRGDNAQPVKSAVRLSVTAQRVDGQWKVSDISQK